MYRPKPVEYRLARKQEKTDQKENGEGQGEIDGVSQYSLEPTMINLIGIRQPVPCDRVPTDPMIG